MTNTSGYEARKEPSVELGWMALSDRPIVLRSTIVAVVLGSILTFINQPGWVSGNEPLQLLPFMLVYLTPFAVVMVAQVAGVRQAHIDSAGQEMPASPESLITTIASHGIPARAAVIGAVFGSLNAILSVADEYSRSGDLAALVVAPLGQAYVLPLVFGLVSQAISYRLSLPGRRQLARTCKKTTIERRSIIMKTRRHSGIHK